MAHADRAEQTQIPADFIIRAGHQAVAENSPANLRGLYPAVNQYLAQKGTTPLANMNAAQLRELSLVAATGARIAVSETNSDPVQALQRAHRDMKVATGVVLEVERREKTHKAARDETIHALDAVLSVAPQLPRSDGMVGVDPVLAYVAEQHLPSALEGRRPRGVRAAKRVAEKVYGLEQKTSASRNGRTAPAGNEWNGLPEVRTANVQATNGHTQIPDTHEGIKLSRVRINGVLHAVSADGARIPLEAPKKTRRQRRPGPHARRTF